MQPLIKGEKYKSGNGAYKDKFKNSFLNILTPDLVIVKIVNPGYENPDRDFKDNGGLRFKNGIVRRGDVVYSEHRTLPVVKRISAVVKF